MRLRIITKDKKFVDYDVKVPITVNTTNLYDKFAVMIVEEKGERRDLVDEVTDFCLEKK